MKIETLRLRIVAAAASAAVMALSGAALADPPSRVARLGYVTGQVSFSPAGEYDWFDAPFNRPLTSGDRLWSDSGARAEVQFGGAMVRMGAGTGASILNLDDRTTQLQLTQGRLNVHVFRVEPGQVFEIDTPNLAFIPREPGDYRIEVDPDGRATTIVVRRGRGEAYGEGAAYLLNSRQSYRFMGTGLRDYDYFDAPRYDDFDRWSGDRDRRYENSTSARYVSRDMVGYEDLDSNGTWRVDVTFGNVWVPNRVPRGWAPYRDGHWAWINPWGWTWMDDAPWGFAVSHYGRWTNFGGTWAWVPGPPRARSYYAPALVVFLGGSNFQVRQSGGNVGGIAWFPLGPRDVYQPSYQVSRRYFEDVNRSNTVISNTVINNYYNNTNVTNVVYVNQQVPGAVVAVPRTVFEQSQPVARTAVAVSGPALASQPVEFAPPVAPTERSVHGATSRSDAPPPAQVFERPVVARTAPPPAQAGFDAQQWKLKERPGKPLDDTARRQLQRGAAVPAPVVNVISQAPEVPPAAPPPPPMQRSNEPQTMPPTQATAPAPAATPAEQRGKYWQQGKSGQHGQPADSQPATPQAAMPPVEPQAMPPTQATAPAPAATSAEQRGKYGQQGKSGQHAQPADAQPEVAQPTYVPPVEPTSPPQRPVEPQAAPSTQATAPPPAATPAEQRGKYWQQGKSGQHGQPADAQPAIPTPAPPPAAVPPVEPQTVPSKNALPAPVEAEPATPVPTPAADKKKGKKKAVDEPPPDEPVPEAPTPPGGTQAQ